MFIYLGRKWVMMWSIHSNPLNSTPHPRYLPCIYPNSHGSALPDFQVPWVNQTEQGSGEVKSKILKRFQDSVNLTGALESPGELLTNRHVDRSQVTSEKQPMSTTVIKQHWSLCVVEEFSHSLMSNLTSPKEETGLNSMEFIFPRAFKTNFSPCWREIKYWSFLFFF